MVFTTVAGQRQAAVGFALLASFVVACGRDEISKDGLASPDAGASKSASPDDDSGAGGAHALDPGRPLGAGGAAVPVDAGAGGNARTDAGPSLIPCTDDAGCAGGRCNPLTGVCQECLFHRDCPEDRICTSGRCTQSAFCVTTNDCASSAGRVCGAENRCVGCGPILGTSGCPSNAACVSGVCVSTRGCLSDLMCAPGEVCSGNVCVGCTTNAHCGPGRACSNNKCRSVCTAEEDCGPLGLHCILGLCAACYQSADCPGPSVCDHGDCRIGECDPKGPAFCAYYADSTSEILSCSPNGRIQSTLRACDSGETCTEGGQEPHCVPEVCAPGSLACRADETGRYAAQCSRDGASIIGRQYCSADEICVDGKCTSCPPGLSLFGNCSPDGSSVFLCAASGPYPKEVCAAGTVCLPAALGASCQAVPCTPGEKTCIGVGLYECVESPDGGAPSLRPSETCPEHCWDGKCVPITPP